jgi:hypothetical protein
MILGKKSQEKELKKIFLKANIFFKMTNHLLFKEFVQII